jgi:hypothetical protein
MEAPKISVVLDEQVDGHPDRGGKLHDEPAVARPRSAKGRRNIPMNPPTIPAPVPIPMIGASGSTEVARRNNAKK